MTIDESMILCKSRFVNWKQYMPLKPIKHGIKVFVLACGETGYVYNCSVYQGKGTGTIIETVLHKLITGDLVDSGRILYVDNYYTSVALGVVMMAMYGLYLCGTYSPRKNGTGDSFPFDKVTPAEASCVERGWNRRAVTTVIGKALSGTKKVVVQAIIWKDSKICGFISTAFVGACAKSSVLRSVKGVYKGLRIKAHDAIIAYLTYHGAVDRADRGIADHTISVRCSRWFARGVLGARRHAVEHLGDCPVPRRRGRRVLPDVQGQQGRPERAVPVPARAGGPAHRLLPRGGDRGGGWRPAQGQVGGADRARPVPVPDRQQQLLPVPAGQRRLLQVPGSRQPHAPDPVGGRRVPPLP